MRAPHLHESLPLRACTSEYERRAYLIIDSLAHTLDGSGDQRRERLESYVRALSEQDLHGLLRSLYEAKNNHPMMFRTYLCEGWKQGAGYRASPLAVYDALELTLASTVRCDAKMKMLVLSDGIFYGEIIDRHLIIPQPEWGDRTSNLVHYCIRMRVDSVIKGASLVGQVSDRSGRHGERDIVLRFFGPDPPTDDPSILRNVEVRVERTHTDSLGGTVHTWERLDPRALPRQFTWGVGEKVVVCVVLGGYDSVDVRNVRFTLSPYYYGGSDAARIRMIDGLIWDANALVQPDAAITLGTYLQRLRETVRTHVLD